MKYVIGFDVGTSSLKTTLMDGEGNIHIEHTIEYPTKTVGEGAAEQDPNDWYDAVIKTLAILRQDYNIQMKDIKAISVTGAMRGLTLIDSDGGVIRDSILWNDTRCGKNVKEAVKRHGDAIQRITNTKLDTGCTLPKILWVREKENASWEKTYKFIFPPNYVAYKLTNRICMDRNNASGTSLYDVINLNDWSDELIALFGLEKEKFPELVDPFENIGYVNKYSARETGLLEGTPVIAAGGDSGVEMFSTGITASDAYKMRLGSAGEMASIFTPQEMEGRENYFCFRHVLKDKLLGGIYILACASAIKWIRNVFYSELPAMGRSYEIMDGEAKSVELGSDGLFFHPYLLGENAPYYDLSLRAMFHGMNINHERRHFVKAAYEGVSYSFKNSMESEDALKNCKKIVVIGGGTKSDLWLSVFVDIMGRPISIPKYCDAAYGATLMAGEGIGWWDSQDIIHKNSLDNRVMEPDFENHKKYNELFKTFKALAEK